MEHSHGAGSQQTSLPAARWALLSNSPRAFLNLPPSAQA